jgi:hypothetical protein
VTDVPDRSSRSQGSMRSRCCCSWSAWRSCRGPSAAASSSWKSGSSRSPSAGQPGTLSCVRQVAARSTAASAPAPSCQHPPRSRHLHEAISCRPSAAAPGLQAAPRASSTHACPPRPPAPPAQPRPAKAHLRRLQLASCASPGSRSRHRPRARSSCSPGSSRAAACRAAQVSSAQPDTSSASRRLQLASAAATSASARPGCLARLRQRRLLQATSSSGSAAAGSSTQPERSREASYEAMPWHHRPLRHGAREGRACLATLRHAVARAGRSHGAALRCAGVHVRSHGRRRQAA